MVESRALGWPATAIFARGVRHLVEVILHIGAHRTGTTSLQRALNRNRRNLIQNRVAYWGPGVTRSGRFSGLLRGPGLEAGETARRIARDRGVIALELQRLQARGLEALLISEENILGSMGANLRSGLLYPGLAERLGRFRAAFGDRCTRIGLAIRPLDAYWASALAYGLEAGVARFGAGTAAQLAGQPRNWRQVIADIAGAFPAAELLVWEFDRLKGRPNAQYRLLSGRRGSILGSGHAHNASPGRAALRALLAERGSNAEAARIGTGDGRFMPFSARQRESLAWRYQQDIDWLRECSRSTAPAGMPAGGQEFQLRGIA